MISFVKQSSNSRTGQKQKRRVRDCLPESHQSSGSEVRTFYENLCAETPSACSPQNTESSHILEVKPDITKPACKPLVKRSTVDLFRAAEQGDIDTLEACVDAGVDCNSTDEHGWTPLMCAAVAYQTEAVKLLLSCKADRTLRNKRNKTASDLAALKKNRDIVKVLAEFGIVKEEREEETEGTATGSDSSFLCDTCSVEVKDSSRKTHVTSTVHLFSSSGPVPGTSFSIPERNIGFQLMLKTGWDKTKGLGSDGQGQKYPVKTLLKRDRRGIGLTDRKKDQLRVTHFSANDTAAVRGRDVTRQLLSVKASNKRKLSAKTRRDNRIARNFRREFY